MSIDALREKNRKIIRAISSEIGERLRLILRVGTGLPPKLSSLIKKMRNAEHKQ